LAKRQIKFNTVNMTIVLFTRENSIYEELGCECYDKKRNAYTAPRGVPVIAHPPCRAWGTMAHWAKPEPGEKDYATWSLSMVNKYGGIVEHPQKSKLWQEKELLNNGFLFGIKQRDFGHVCEKPTYLYIVGISKSELPPVPISLSYPTHKIQSDKRPGAPKHWANKIQREGTPPLLAKWLLEIMEKIILNLARKTL
jgi:hypothetical protein